MKDLKEIKKDLEKCQAGYTELNTQLKDLENTRISNYEQFRLNIKNSNSKSDDLDKYNTISNKLVNNTLELENKAKIKKIELTTLKNNYKATLIYNVLPGISDIFKKYKGKSIGSKTKDKIIDEINRIISEQDDSFYCYFKYNHYDTIDGIVLKNKDSYELFYIYHKAYTFCDDNNKLKDLEYSDFIVNIKYIENHEEYIKNQIKLFNEINDMKDKLNIKIKEFNSINSSNSNIFEYISESNISRNML